MGKFLKGYMQKKVGFVVGRGRYAQSGGSRGFAQACDQAVYFRSEGRRC
jgi:hypothetical protein